VSRKPAQTIVSIIMNVLILLAIAITARLVVEFFGQLAAQDWGKALVALTNPLVIPFGLDAIKTPYGGVFDVNAGIMVAVFLGAEWILSGVRSRA
jgi:uncharacterized protein YggT (Ycf19 family)